MRIIYVTACLPYGRAETFIISEIKAMMQRHDILVVPRSPGRLGQHAAWMAPNSISERLLGGAVMVRSTQTLVRKPVSSVRCLAQIAQSKGVRNNLANAADYPKGLWLASVAERWRADHIHCHWAGTTATMAMVASQVSGIPWSMTCHRSDIVSNNLLQEKARHASFVRTIAADGRRMLLDRGVEASPKLIVLPMGVDVPAVPPSSRLGETPVVLCPADLLPVKGHRFLIEAWSILRRRGIKAKLILAGAGHLLGELRSQVSGFGLNDDVIFAGTLQHERLLGYYRGGEIAAVVLASIDLGGGVHEGVPVSLVEAMAHSVPVLATVTGGIPELIVPGTGILVPPADAAALADGLERLLRNPESAQMMARKGRQWVIQTRDSARIASRLESLVEALVDLREPAKEIFSRAAHT